MINLYDTGFTYNVLDFNVDDLMSNKNQIIHRYFTKPVLDVGYVGLCPQRPNFCLTLPYPNTKKPRADPGYLYIFFI